MLASPALSEIKSMSPLVVMFSTRPARRSLSANDAAQELDATASELSPHGTRPCSDSDREMEVPVAEMLLRETVWFKVGVTDVDSYPETVNVVAGVRDIVRRGEVVSACESVATVTDRAIAETVFDVCSDKVFEMETFGVGCVTVVEFV